MLFQCSAGGGNVPDPNDNGGDVPEDPTGGGGAVPDPEPQIGTSPEVVAILVLAVVFLVAVLGGVWFLCRRQRWNEVRRKFDIWRNQKIASRDRGAQTRADFVTPPRHQQPAAPKTAPAARGVGQLHDGFLNPDAIVNVIIKSGPNDTTPENSFERTEVASEGPLEVRSDTQSGEIGLQNTLEGSFDRTPAEMLSNNFEITGSSPSLAWEDDFVASTPLTGSMANPSFIEATSDSIISQQDQVPIDSSPRRRPRKRPDPPSRSRSICGKVHRIGESCSICLSHDAARDRAGVEGNGLSPINLSRGSSLVSERIRLNDFEEGETLNDEISDLTSTLIEGFNATIRRIAGNGISPGSSASNLDGQDGEGLNATLVTVNPEVTDIRRLEFTVDRSSATDDSPA